MRFSTFALGAVLSCGSPKAAPTAPTADTTPATSTSDPAAAPSGDDCKTILAEALATAKPDGPPASEPTAVLETDVKAEAIALRGADSVVCVSWRRRAVCDEELVDGACPDEAGGSDTVYVLAVVDPTSRAITDQRTLGARATMTDSDGALSWKVVAVGPEADALRLTSTADSGDTSLSRELWLTIAGGTFVDHMRYKHGVDGGDEIGSVTYEVLDDVENGFFKIRFDIEKDGDKTSDTCAWDAAARGYRCEKDLLDEL